MVESVIPGLWLRKARSFGNFWSEILLSLTSQEVKATKVGRSPACCWRIIARIGRRRERGTFRGLMCSFWQIERNGNKELNNVSEFLIFHQDEDWLPCYWRKFSEYLALKDERWLVCYIAFVDGLQVLHCKVDSEDRLLQTCTFLKEGVKNNFFNERRDFVDTKHVM